MSNKSKKSDTQGKGNGNGKGSNAKKLPLILFQLCITLASDMELVLNMVKQHGILVPASTTNIDNAVEPEKEVILEQYPFKKGKLRKIPHQSALLTLLDFPKYIENTESAAKLLLLVLLSQVFPLLVESLVSFPVLLLRVPPLIASNVIGPLLRAIQGPETWEGKNWRLRRTWVIGAKLAFGETVPSTSIVDYLGGIFKEKKRKWREFWLPLIGSAMVLLSSLPAAVVRKIIDLSPLAMPILLAPAKTDPVRPIVELEPQGFDSYDEDGIKALESSAENCHMLIVCFLRWFCGDKKNIRRWQESIDTFRPVARRGRFIQPKTDDGTDLLCAALAFLRQLLLYASEIENWITRKDAQEAMLWYWRTVLPESAPPEEGNTQEEAAALAYDTPEAFYQFLTEYFLPTYHGQVLLAATGTQGTMGLLHKVANGDETYFITPRALLLEVYARWLDERHAAAFDLSAYNGEAAVQRKLLEAGIPLKGEKGNPATWRYKFYGTGEKVNCLALPLAQLPKAVQSVFGQLFGTPLGEAAIPNSSEAAPDSRKEVKYL